MPQSLQKEAIHLHLENIGPYTIIFYHNQRKADPSIDYVVIPREQKGKNDVYDPLITSYETLGYKESKYATKELFILEKPE